jgi:hypothetical protein
MGAFPTLEGERSPLVSFARSPPYVRALARFIHPAKRLSKTPGFPSEATTPNRMISPFNHPAHADARHHTLTYTQTSVRW